MDEVLQTIVSVHGHSVRVTATQWAHITEAHDYMAGNLDKVIETIAEPTAIVAGTRGESYALRNYARQISRAKLLLRSTATNRMGLSLQRSLPLSPNA